MIVAAGVYALFEIVPWIIIMVIANRVSAGETASVGIIVGADGPTSIFVTTPEWTSVAMGAVICAVVLIVGIVLLRKAKR